MIMGKEIVLEALFETLMDEPQVYDRFCDRIEQGYEPFLASGNQSVQLGEDQAIELRLPYIDREQMLSLSRQQSARNMESH